MSEIAEAIDDLFGRATANTQLQAASGDQVGSTGVLSHVKRVLITHVDDSCPDLNSARLRARRRKEREGGGELARKVMNAEIGAICTEFLGGNGKIDGLQQRV